MEGLAVLAIIGIILYATSHSAPESVTGAGVVTPPGGGTARTSSGAQPGGGGSGAAGAGAAVLTPLIRQAGSQIQPGSVPSPPASLLQTAQASPVDVAQVAADSGVSLAEFSVLAGQFNMAPETLAGAIQAGSGLDIANTVVTAGEISAETAGSAGAALASAVGWALPIAAAVALGGMILRAALTRRGSFGESKDRSRAAVARLGMAEAYRIADAVLDALIATGRPPAAFTREVALRTGYVFAVWTENVDSFHDAFQGTPGGLEAWQRLRAKLGTYISRRAEVDGWWAQVLRFVQQADQSWGLAMAPQLYIEEIGRQVPPPAWLRMWQDFRDLASLGYTGMLAYLRDRVQWETVGRWAGEGGNQ